MSQYGIYTFLHFWKQLIIFDYLKRYWANIESIFFRLLKTIGTYRSRSSLLKLFWKKVFLNFLKRIHRNTLSRKPFLIKMEAMVVPSLWILWNSSEQPLYRKPTNGSCPHFCLKRCMFILPYTVQLLRITWKLYPHLKTENLKNWNQIPFEILAF